MVRMDDVSILGLNKKIKLKFKRFGLMLGKKRIWHYYFFATKGTVRT
jgi:hypothetical protein